MIIYYDNGSRPLLREHFRDSGVPCATIYRSRAAQAVNRLTRRRFRPRSLLYNLPECAPGDDKVIVFDTYTNPAYLQWLCRRYPDKRIILWYWNPVGNPRSLDMFPRRVEIWSYSLRDCRACRLHHNTAFYFDSMARAAARAPAVRSERPRALFIGREKGRTEALKRLEAELAGAGAVPEFHIMRNNERSDRTPGREPLMPYGAIAERVKASDVLLDYTTDPEAGLSLRAMESLFWRKKLITNNRTVLQADFYRPENIFVLGADERPLKDFLAGEGVPVPDGIRDGYLLSRWLRRFDAQVAE